eukprot:8280298-Pyramimonas_sp.AAC.1
MCCNECFSNVTRSNLDAMRLAWAVNAMDDLFLPAREYTVQKVAPSKTVASRLAALLSGEFSAARIAM